VLASDRGQARNIFRFVIGFLRAAPLLEQLIVRADAETIELSNRVTIEIATASFRSARGYSFAAVLCDEAAFWRFEESSANPDVEVIRALRPGLATIPGSVLLIASSPYAKKGELYGAYRRHYGKDDAKVLVWKADTATMNPSPALAPIIAEAYESDPAAAKSEYGAEFRDDLADYITLEAVEAVTMWGRIELPPMPGVVYVAFCDPSGGVGDAMTLAIGHLSGDICVLDAILVVQPPFDPEEATAQCAALIKRYGVAVVMSDRYAGEWVRSRFARHGIEVIYADRPKSDFYLDLLPLVVSRRVELLDFRRLRDELTGLERKTARSGKDSIDHAPGGHDDLANAVAGVLVGLDLDRRPALVRLEDVAGGKGDAAQPRWLQYVYAMIVDAGPDIAIVWCGSIANDYDRGTRETLWVLDLDVVFFKPGLWGELVGRLKALAQPWRAMAAVFAPEHLAFQVSGLGVRVEALPPEFDPELMLTFAAECIGAGLVRFCPAVTARMKTQAIAAALALRAGDPVETALRAALISAIFVKHGSQAPVRRRKLA
jgi:hypothetical protein